MKLLIVNFLSLVLQYVPLPVDLHSPPNDEITILVKEIDNLLLEIDSVRASTQMPDLEFLAIETEKIDRIKRVFKRKREEFQNEEDYLDHLQNIKWDAVVALNRLESVVAFHHDLELHLDRLELKYYDTWNKVFNYKKRIDNLFVDKEFYDFNFGGLEDKEVLKVRKKSLYEAVSKVYDYDMHLLRNLKQCDYEGRIKLMNKTMELLVKTESLLYEENTKLVEKTLRKEENVDTIRNVIIDYDLE